MSSFRAAKTVLMDPPAKTLVEFLRRGISAQMNRDFNQISMSPGLYRGIELELSVSPEHQLDKFMGYKVYVSDAVPPGTFLLVKV